MTGQITARLGWAYGLLRRSFIWLGISIRLAAMAAAVYLFAGFERDRFGDIAVSYEHYWTSHQLLAEYQQMMVDVARAEAGDPQIGRGVLQVRLDILASRRSTLESGPMAEAFRGLATYDAVVAAIGESLIKADALMADPTVVSVGQLASGLDAVLSDLAAPAKDLRLAVREHYAEHFDGVQKRMGDYLTLIAALFAIGAGGTFCFVVVYLRQHRRLRRSEETFRRTFDQAGVGIGHLALDGRWLRINATLREMLERCASEFDLQDVRALFPDVKEVRALVAPLVSGHAQVMRLERSYPCPEGGTFFALFTLSLVGKPSGQTDYVIVVMEDVTERKMIEAQLRHAQKMEAVGQLTGGIAHDFNNLLGVVVGNLDMLNLRLERGRDAEARTHLNRALDATEKAAALTARLLAFSRRQTLMPIETDVNRLVGEITTLLEPTIGDNVTIRTSLMPFLTPAMIDPGQLEAALVNLAINARDAMDRGGVLEISTERRRVDDGKPIGDLARGDFVVITVSDTGIGIAPEVLERVFEPFFTTKDIGKGTGLGLSMVYGFVKQSGGHVQIESAPGGGTTVRLFLPAAFAMRAEVA